MKFWLEIQRTSGIERRSITPGAQAGTAKGSCPGCKATPFLVAGQGIEHQGGGLYRAGGKCLGCKESVGYIFAEEQQTIFGAEEDRAMGEFARCRVYGGAVRS